MPQTILVEAKMLTLCFYEYAWSHQAYFGLLAKKDDK